MSYMRPGEDGGHTNGYGGSYGGLGARRYDVDGSSRDTSADERSRSRGPPGTGIGGGYGGFARDTRPQQRVAGPSQLERRQANRRSGDRGWSASRSRSRAGPRFGEGSRQVEEILRYIEQQWSFMSSDNCVAIKVALQLMDSSSLGLADQYEQFQQVHQQLQNTLKQIVNEHHQGFNSSIGTFHQIQASIQASQQRVRGLRESLLEAKGNLSTTKPELKTFATSSQRYDSMLQMLTHIEELQAMPEKIEAQISEKRFFGAVETLQDALKLMRKPELEEIGALSDLQVYLSNQEHSLTDILIEELHSHLYLKSPYCEDRWKRYASRNNGSESISIGTERRQLYSFLESLDVSGPVIEDVSHNPEAESFSYMKLLLESLDRMSRLDVAADAIEQRLPVEMFRVVEKCYNEVEQRHPSISRKAGTQAQDRADMWTDEQDRKEIVEDMLSSLYARFEAIAEGHRAVHDVIFGITRRQGVRDASLLRNFHELWKLYQSEIRSLLHDHLSTSGNLEGRSHRDGDSTANIFRPHVRDKTRRLFKLSDTDSNSTSIVSEKEDLDYILKSSVPGLASSNSHQMGRTNENTMPDRSATGHKLLVQPSVFNMGLLLPPSLSFLTRLKDVVPANSDVAVSTLTSFLDDFLVNVFLPQMEETLADQCGMATNQSDAFQEDPKWDTRAPRPLFKGTVQLADLISSFCRMLDSLPPDQSFNELIIGQLRNYYNRCHECYQAIVTKQQADSSASRILRRAAESAETGDLAILLKNPVHMETQHQPDSTARETAFILASARAQPIQDADLLLDHKSLRQLSTLYTSIRWLTTRILSMRQVVTTDSKSPTNLLTHQQSRWTLSSTPATTQPYLPLSPETAPDFDALTENFTALSSLLHRTLYLEVRLQLVSGISRALSTTYLLSQPYNDPDPSILSLNKSLLSLDEDLRARLPEPQYVQSVSHLSELANSALVSFASAVPAMDEHGHARMQLNVLVLQQNLKELDARTDLSRAARFWELWEGGGEAVVAAVGQGLGKEEARELVRLCYSVPPEKGGPGLGQKGLDEVLGEIERA